MTNKTPKITDPFLRAAARQGEAIWRYYDRQGHHNWRIAAAARLQEVA